MLSEFEKHSVMALVEAAIRKVEHTVRDHENSSEPHAGLLEEIRALREAVETLPKMPLMWMRERA